MAILLASYQVVQLAGDFSEASTCDQLPRVPSSYRQRHSVADLEESVADGNDDRQAPGTHKVMKVDGSDDVLFSMSW